MDEDTRIMSKHNAFFDISAKTDYRSQKGQVCGFEKRSTFDVGDVGES